MPKPKPADAPAVTPDFLNELKRLSNRVDVAAAELERGKQKVKVLKEVHDELDKELHDFIRGTDGAAPLFDQEEEDET